MLARADVGDELFARNSLVTEIVRVALEVTRVSTWEHKNAGKVAAALGRMLVKVRHGLENGLFCIAVLLANGGETGKDVTARLQQLELFAPQLAALGIL